MIDWVIIVSYDYRVSIKEINKCKSLQLRLTLFILFQRTWQGKKQMDFWTLYERSKNEYYHWYHCWYSITINNKSRFVDWWRSDFSKKINIKILEFIFNIFEDLWSSREDSFLDHIENTWKKWFDRKLYEAQISFFLRGTGFSIWMFSSMNTFNSSDSLRNDISWSESYLSILS